MSFLSSLTHSGKLIKPEEGVVGTPDLLTYVVGNLRTYYLEPASEARGRVAGNGANDPSLLCHEASVKSRKYSVQFPGWGTQHPG